MPNFSGPRIWGGLAHVTPGCINLTVKFVLLIVVPPAFVTAIGPVGWNRSSEGLPGPDMHGGEAPPLPRSWGEGCMIEPGARFVESVVIENSNDIVNGLDLDLPFPRERHSSAAD